MNVEAASPRLHCLLSGFAFFFALCISHIPKVYFSDIVMYISFNFCALLGWEGVDWAQTCSFSKAHPANKSSELSRACLMIMMMMMRTVIWWWWLVCGLMMIGYWLIMWISKSFQFIDAFEYFQYILSDYAFVVLSRSTAELGRVESRVQRLCTFLLAYIFCTTFIDFHFIIPAIPALWFSI